MRIVIATIASVVCGCGLSTAVSTGYMPIQPHRAAVPINQVALVFTNHVDKPYQELGVASIAIGPPTLSFTSSPAPSPNEVLDKLRAIGASNGCDALLVNPTAYSRYAEHVSAVCIAYR